jgi:1,4-dihydroxy-2-naphthoate octaprenyltransferase
MNATAQSGRRASPKWRLLLAELRAPFLTASAVPVLVGTATAYYQTGAWHWPVFLWTLAGVALIHSGANVANDYYDHLSGNDAANTDFVRPFTGGSRLIQKGLLAPAEVRRLSLVCLALGGAIGIFLAVRCGWPVLLLGLVGIAGGVFYSAPPAQLAARGLGELTIAVNFGVLPVLGAHFVQTGRFSWEAALIALPVAILIAAVVFINQFQDCAADGAVGRRNWVVRLGRKRAARVFALLVGVWPLPLAAAIWTGAAPDTAWIALPPLALAAVAIPFARRYHDDPRRLTPANAATIAMHAAAGLLLAAALVWARLAER